MTNLVIDAYEFASRYYDIENMRHASNVAKMVAHERFSNSADSNAAIIGAIFHDLVEDTSCSFEEIEKQFGIRVRMVVEKLTIKKDQSYTEYMDEILRDRYTEIGYFVYLIKKADMKDHFTRYKTMTPKLMEKYLPYIHEFM